MSIKLENVHFPNVVDVVCFRRFPEINTEIKRDMKYEKCYFSFKIPSKTININSTL